MLLEPDSYNHQQKRARQLGQDDVWLQVVPHRITPLGKAPWRPSNRSPTSSAAPAVDPVMHFVLFSNATRRKPLLLALGGLNSWIYHPTVGNAFHHSVAPAGIASARSSPTDSLRCARRLILDQAGAFFATKDGSPLVNGISLEHFTHGCPWYMLTSRSVTAVSWNQHGDGAQSQGNRNGQCEW